jgi:hypothetical protein
MRRHPAVTAFRQRGYSPPRHRDGGQTTEAIPGGECARNGAIAIDHVPVRVTQGHFAPRSLDVDSEPRQIDVLQGVDLDAETPPLGEMGDLGAETAVTVVEQHGQRRGATHGPSVSAKNAPRV